MKSARCLVAWCIAMLAVVQAASRHDDDDDRPCGFPAIYNFGDSNSDTGATSAAFFPRAWPSGETFFHEPAGRTCDGRLIIDFIAEKLKLPYLDAYLDSIATGFETGANFATGGSTIRQQNESFLFASPFSLDVQLAQFINFKARTSGRLKFFSTAIKFKKPISRKELPNPKDFAKALYTIDIGQNDLSAGFRKLSHQQLLAAILDILTVFALQIQNLYNLTGARTFWIHNTGPIGCLPSTLINLPSPPPSAITLDEYGCVKEQNDMAKEFNKQLMEKVAQLRTQLPLAAITYVDVHAAKMDLIANSSSHGFVDPRKICCGYFRNGSLIVGCGRQLLVNGIALFGGSCEDPASHISWDGVHYTEAANRWIADRIIDGSLSDPPVSITRACRLKMSI
uniref:Uncharacterized protein n=1 Tax=Kalanchoe fedtschenkoi TaxID=63787 RepID=A0A7N0VKE6_KALFE